MPDSHRDEDSVEVLREALLGACLAWAVAAEKGSTEALALMDAEIERARKVAEARRERG